MSICYFHADMGAETIDKESMSTENGSRRTLITDLDKLSPDIAIQSEILFSFCAILY